MIFAGLFIKTDSLPHPSANSDTVTNAFNIVLGVMGAVAFLMLVIAGFRYVLSGGESSAVAESKRMIIYSIVGLVVIALAATIVNFVVSKA
jgi:hypothetical protein